MHQRFLYSLSALWLCVASAGAATVTIDNLNAAGDGAYGLADNSGALLTTAAGQVMLGRMTMSDASIANNFNLGNIAAIWAAFQPFDIAFDPDSLAPGAFQIDLSADTRASQNALGGSAIYVWAWNSSSATPLSATQGLIAHLSDVFPTDPELPDSPLFAITHLRSPAVLVVGTSGPQTYDYGLGSGPLSEYRMDVAGAAPEPSRAVLMIMGACLVIFRRRR